MNDGTPYTENAPWAGGFVSASSPNSVATEGEDGVDTVHGIVPVGIPSIIGASALAREAEDGGDCDYDNFGSSSHPRSGFNVSSGPTTPPHPSSVAGPRAVVGHGAAAAPAALASASNYRFNSSSSSTVAHRPTTVHEPMRRCSSGGAGGSGGEGSSLSFSTCGLQSLGASLLSSSVPFGPPQATEGDRDRRRAVGHAVGIYNLGNTCYMGSALQCLAHIDAFYDWLQTHYEACSNDHDADVWCIACELAKCFHSLFRPAQRQAFTPDMLGDALTTINPRFRLYRQEDSQEYLVSLLDLTEKHCRLRASLPHYPSRTRSIRDPTQSAAHVHATTLPECTLFRGVLSSRVTCGDKVCRKNSDTRDLFETLSLEITGSDLSSCLKSFTSFEILDADNKYKCEGCKQLVTATKSIKLEVAPAVLCIHLKRFSYRGWSCVKNAASVRYPLEMDMSPYMRLSEAQVSAAEQAFPASIARDMPGGKPVVRLMYHLTGIVIHQGFSAQSGHYYAFVRRATSAAGPSGGQWMEMNDSYRSTKSVGEVLGQQAYMLFYVPAVPALVQCLADASTKRLTAQHTEGHGATASAAALAARSPARASAATGTSVTPSSSSSSSASFLARQLHPPPPATAAGATLHKLPYGPMPSRSQFPSRIPFSTSSSAVVVAGAGGGVSLVARPVVPVALPLPTPLHSVLATTPPLTTVFAAAAGHRQAVATPVSSVSSTVATPVAPKPPVDPQADIARLCKQAGDCVVRLTHLLKAGRVADEQQSQLISLLRECVRYGEQLGRATHPIAGVLYQCMCFLDAGVPASQFVKESELAKEASLLVQLGLDKLKHSILVHTLEGFLKIYLAACGKGAPSEALAGVKRPASAISATHAPQGTTVAATDEGGSGDVDGASAVSDPKRARLETAGSLSGPSADAGAGSRHGVSSGGSVKCAGSGLAFVHSANLGAQPAATANTVLTSTTSVPAPRVVESMRLPLLFPDFVSLSQPTGGAGVGLGGIGYLVAHLFKPAASAGASPVSLGASHMQPSPTSATIMRPQEAASTASQHSLVDYPESEDDATQ